MVDSKNIVSFAARLFSHGFGAGLIRKAPGTYGSLVGLLFAYILYLATHAMNPNTASLVSIVVTGLVVVLAYVAIARYEADTGSHDDQRVVADEIAGQMITCLFCPPTIIWYAVAFALFRLLDISKPSLIGHIDRNGKGAYGTLGDDIVAGLVAGVLCLALQAVVRMAAQPV